MPQRERLKADLKKAMKARESQTVTVLRSLLAAIDNAEAVELGTSSSFVIGRANDVPRKALSEAQIREVLRGEVEELQTAVAEYERLGKLEEAETLSKALDVASGYVSETPTENYLYHKLSFQRGEETDAFVRALQRFLDSPRGSVYISGPQSTEIWTTRELADDPLEVYLNDSALAATEAAFAPAPVQNTQYGDSLPNDMVLWLRGTTLNLG